MQSICCSLTGYTFFAASPSLHSAFWACPSFKSGWGMNHKQVTIVMVLHDLNHAIMFSDYLVAIKDGTLHSAGTPQEVITQQALREIFDVEAEVITHPVLNVPVCLPFRITEQNKKTGGSNT